MLTKSDFRRYLECPNEFWLDANVPYKQPERTLSESHRREEGYDVQRLAAALRIFQPREGIRVEPSKRFEAENLLAISDFVSTDLTTGEIEIYEAKATNSPDDKKHLHDVAFQAYVARKAGFNVRKVFLVTCDKAYVRDGEIDCEKLILVTDVTDEEAAVADEIAAKAEAALTCHENEPEASLLPYCANKLECRFIRHHFPEIPAYNVSHVFSRGKKLDGLLSQHIVTIDGIPADTEPTARQQREIDVYCSQQPHVDTGAIHEELENLTYPMHFLDYEAFGHAIPLFDRLGPYEPVLFQYSLHVVPEAGAEAQPFGYLSRGDNGHPTEEVAARLRNDFGPDGSVIVWNKTYEKRCNEISGRIFPEYADFFANLTERIYDLRDIFQKQLYVHPASKGSDSIKAVLPALFPDDPAYRDLDIGEGNDASIQWYHMIQGRGGEAVCKKTYEDLCEYCALDTFAMVKIHRFLSAI
jgi:CRISPR/Cas system-associated exonuclease Cas4 (RecB family)